MRNYTNYYIWWEALKEWIDDQCLYDNDTITYMDLVEKMKELEEELNDKNKNDSSK